MHGAGTLMSGGAETERGAWNVVPRLSGGVLSASAVLGYVAVGAAAVLGRTLRDAAGEAFTWVLSRDADPQRDHDVEAGVRHTLRVVEDDFDGAQPFGGLAGATHMIVYNPGTPHAQASLAHEFAHVLLAVVRGGPADEVGVSSHPLARLESEEAHVEECAAWALARGITRGAIWGRAALAYREQALCGYGVPAWARAPRVPHPALPTRALVRWLAQTPAGE
jgi:hypothetical protein